MNIHDVKFLRKLISESLLERGNDGVAARVCQADGVGRAVGRKIVYSAADHSNAKNILLSRGYEIEEGTVGHARSDAPKGGSEKRGARRVTEGLLAFKGIGMDDVLRCPAGALIGAHMDSVLELEFDAVLVCENLEPLMLIESYVWLEKYYKRRRVLALFRGGKETYRTDAAAEFLRRTEKPTLGFFDFDPKGLSMAASLPRMESLCLPEWSDLEMATKYWRRDNLFAQSVETSRSHLDRVTRSDIAIAWKRLRHLAIGLDQEHFPYVEVKSEK